MSFGQPDEDEDDTLEFPEEGDPVSYDKDESDLSPQEEESVDSHSEDAHSEIQPASSAPVADASVPVDKQQAIRDFISKQYGEAADPSAVNAARAQATEDRRNANIGHAISQIFRSGSMAYGGAGPNEALYKNLKDQAEIPVAEAEADRQAKIREFVTQKAMQRQQAQDVQHVKDSAERNAELRRWHDDEAKRRDNEAKRRDEASKETRDWHREVARGRTQATTLAKEEKEAKALDELRVGDIGIARTADDAKKLKDAASIKDSFDAKVKELITLRKDKGAEAWDREAVNRGKQLSKELLLDYKNLKSLGVLSKSDESIVNQVIPEDPLQWNASSLMGGQDPTMTAMQKFQGDMDADFRANLKTRLRDGGAGYAAKHPPATDEPAGGPGEALAAPKGKAKTVVQGGHTYTLNEETGEYE